MTASRTVATDVVESADDAPRASPSCAASSAAARPRPAAHPAPQRVIRRGERRVRARAQRASQRETARRENVVTTQVATVVERASRTLVQAGVADRRARRRDPRVGRLPRRRPRRGPRPGQAARPHISPGGSSTSPPSTVGAPAVRARPVGSLRPPVLACDGRMPSPRRDPARRSRPSSTPSCGATSSSSSMVRSIDIKDGGRRRRHRLADHARLPDQEPLPDRRRQGRRRPRGRHARQRRLRRPLRPGEGRAAEEARPPGGLPEGALAQVAERHLHRLGQGRRRQVHADRQPRRRAGRRGQAGRRPRRRRLGLLDPAHVRPRRRPPAGQRRAQDPPARRPRREGHVDRLLRRGGRRRRLARADAPQGAHPVPRGRRVGRARLPARRPAAGHRRRLDDARPAAAAGASS